MHRSRSPAPSAFLAVRTAVPPMSIVPALSEAVRSIHNRDNRSTESDPWMKSCHKLTERFVSRWLYCGSSRTLALILSAMGIFGVTPSTVNRRTREMAIRIALGANSR